jgi:RNA polymerase sigma-70 factor, ECF subfamily
MVFLLISGVCLLGLTIRRVNPFANSPGLFAYLTEMDPVNTCSSSNVYDYAGISAMASGYGDRVDSVAASLRNQPVSEQSRSEFTEDEMLVRAARNGDRAAFGRLYDRYARMVHGLLLAKVPVGEVDDLVQDVFVMALRRLSTLRKTGSFGAWLAAIARNLANDRYRRSAPEDQLTNDATEMEIDYGTNSRNDRVAAGAILDAIRSLPDTYKETLILRLVEGMTGPEIAARTGLTHGSVRVNLHRGMQLLRVKLKPNLNGNGSEKEMP